MTQNRPYFQTISYSELKHCNGVEARKLKDNFIFALWLRRKTPMSHAEVTNKLDGIFNVRYPVYHLKEEVVKFAQRFGQSVKCDVISVKIEKK